MKKKSKLDESATTRRASEGSSPIKSGKGSNQQMQQGQGSQETQEVLKVTKTRFKQHFHDILLELAADEEIMVQVDGVELMNEFLSVFKRQTIEADFIPHVDRVFKKVLDTATCDEVRIKVTEYSGKILEKLAHY